VYNFRTALFLEFPLVVPFQALGSYLFFRERYRVLHPYRETNIMVHYNILKDKLFSSKLDVKIF
jgi:hypothetical protein